jgi:hypothetical protein
VCFLICRLVLSHRQLGKPGGEWQHGKSAWVARAAVVFDGSSLDQKICTL